MKLPTGGERAITASTWVIQLWPILGGVAVILGLFPVVRFSRKRKSNIVDAGQ